MRQDKKTSLTYWYPKIKDYVRTPDTEIVETVPCKEKEFPFRRVWDDIEEIKHIIEDRLGGYPVFARTDFASYKHNMENASKIDSENELESNLSELLYFNEVASAMGLPYDYLVFREWLDLAYHFKAFKGTPIAVELRFFVNDGDIICKHFYWPIESMSFSNFDPEEEESEEYIIGDEKEYEEGFITGEKMVTNNIVGPKGWVKKWERTRDEALMISERAVPHVKKVAEILDGYWSVDIAFTTDCIPYVIDLAVGEKSWHPECDKELNSEQI